MQDGDRRGFDVITVNGIHQDGARIFLRLRTAVYPHIEFTRQMAVATDAMAVQL